MSWIGARYPLLHAGRWRVMEATGEPVRTAETEIHVPSRIISTHDTEAEARQACGWTYPAAGSG